MSTLKVSAEEETFSSISNNFIDYYMNEANGDFVKLYLYLARLCSSGAAISVSDIADHLNCTEKDVCRGIKYWIKQNVLKLSYNEENEPSGIIICSLSKPANVEKTKSDNTISLNFDSAEPVEKKKTAKKEAKKEESETEAKAAAESSVPKKESPTPAALNSALQDPMFSNLKSEAEAYCDKVLSKNDIDSLIYIYDTLKLSFDLIEYLLEYCASIKKTKFSYIEAVAINWYNNNITTREEAEEFTIRYYSLYTKILKELGITTRMPAPAERQLIDHWTKDFGFTEPLILEACRRAIASKPNSVSFNYVNGILENWYNSNVRSFSDINVLDDKHKRSKKSSSSAGSTPNSFSESSSTSSDLRELENLYLQGVKNS
jgi:DnaD/phage-associated family protein